MKFIALTDATRCEIQYRVNINFVTRYSKLSAGQRGTYVYINEGGATPTYIHVAETLEQIDELINMNSNPPTQDPIQELIREHKEADPGLSLAFLYQGPGPTKILEVSTSVPTIGEILPYDFPKEQGEPLGYTLILCSPQDYARIQAGELKLPPDWTNPSPITLS